MTSLVRLLLRRHRVALIAWLGGLLALAASAAPSYETAYGTGAAREALIRGLQADAGLTLMYGRLHGSTLGDLFAWEIGMYLLVLGGVMAALLGVAMTRGEEDAGTLEVVRATGLRPGAPLDAALVVLALAALVLGGGTGLVLAIQRAAGGDLGVTGIVLFSVLLTLTTLVTGLLAVLAGQLRGDARSARGLVLGAVAVFFVVRVVADDRGWGWLNWLSPWGWREVLRPFTQDRVWALAPLVAVVVVLLVVVVALGRRREVGAALLPDRSASSSRLRVGGIGGWARREARGAVLGWAVTVVGLAALFGSMAQSLTTILQDSPETAAMIDLMTGDALATLTATFITLLVSFVMLLVMIAAVGLVLRWRGEERSGRLVHELAAGIPRWRSLSSRVAVAVGCAVVLSAAAGLTLGAVAAHQLDDEAVLRLAVEGSVGQLPALLAALGITALLVAVAPRFAPAVWALVAWSGVVAWLGGLLRLPDAVLETGLLQHAPQVTASSSSGWMTWSQWGDWLLGWPLALLAVGVVGLVAAPALVGRRDLRLG